VASVSTRANKGEREEGKATVRQRVTDGRIKIAADELARIAAERANHFEP
jgi:hypothetical protein